MSNFNRGRVTGPITRGRLDGSPNPSHHVSAQGTPWAEVQVEQADGSYIDVIVFGDDCEHPLLFPGHWLSAQGEIKVITGHTREFRKLKADYLRIFEGQPRSPLTSQPDSIVISAEDDEV